MRLRGETDVRMAVIGACVLLALAALLVLPSLGAGANGPWTVTGAGYGHGAGMSQWGAYGYAKRGRSAKQILSRYYRGTSLGKVGAKKIRVLLRAAAETVSFSGVSSGCGRTLNAASTYAALRTGGSVVLADSQGNPIATCGAVLTVKGGGNLAVTGKGRYRGSLEVRPAAGSGVNAVNVVGLEKYVMGVIANESPSTWPAAALRAQAVAARSYVLATRGGGSDVYDDTRSQVYGGRGTETTATNKAVTATKRKIVRHAGKVATTFFFSSSGGRTENIELAMPGTTAQPYLVSVKDPYDKAAPLHRWTRSFSDAEMDAALGDLVPGNLTAVQVTKTGRSPRIVRATLVGTTGTANVSGATLRARLALPSTWATFSRN